MHEIKHKPHLLCRFIAFVLILGIVASIPFVAVTCAAFKIPPQYENTYYAALEKKVERLYQTSGERVVVIGGSSTAFGIDSKIVEDELGMPCVNLGLYAAFGLKCMLDLSLEGLNKGDIVVVAPEFSSQMYSEYVGYSYLLQAFDNSPSTLISLGREYYTGLLEALPSHISEKWKFYKTGSPEPEGVYSINSFDLYGDIIYERPENIMDGMFSEDNLPEISAELVSKSFTDMINEYAAAASRKGAKVFFGFCPVNQLSVEKADNVDLEAFLTELESKLECPILSSLDDHIMDAGYFYDSNFHMNNAGAIYNTILLVDDVKRVKGEMSLTLTQIPEPVVGTASSDVLASGVFEGFMYEVTTQGAVIIGLDESGITSEELRVPDSIEGFSVYKIGASVFEGCKAATIEIPACVSVLSSSLFKDAENLQTVYLMSNSLPEVGENLMNGASESVTVFVPIELYGDYVTDYFWARYAYCMAAIE